MICLVQEKNACKFYVSNESGHQSFPKIQITLRLVKHWDWKNKTNLLLSNPKKMVDPYTTP